MSSWHLLDSFPDDVSGYYFLKIGRNYPLMAALMLVLVLCIMNMLVDVILTLMFVCMFVLIICMATHLDSPPVSYLIILSSKF